MGGKEKGVRGASLKIAWVGRRRGWWCVSKDSMGGKEKGVRGASLKMAWVGRRRGCVVRHLC
eukprot:scaffold10843_cov88-Isochrysis_galbana.AAC.2